MVEEAEEETIEVAAAEATEEAVPDPQQAGLQIQTPTTPPMPLIPEVKAEVPSPTRTLHLVAVITITAGVLLLGFVWSHHPAPGLTRSPPSLKRKIVIRIEVLTNSTT